MENLSKFPKQIDEFPRLYDLPASLAVKAKRYQELKMLSVLDAVEQEELNGLIADLGNYIITPQTMNKVTDGMVNLQLFFKGEVDGYIEAKQKEWAKYVKEFRYIEVHNKNKAYNFQNMVQVSKEEDNTITGGTLSQGDLYLALQDVPKGIELDNAKYWQKISAKGDKGDVGLNAHLKGSYQSNVEYVVGDAVYYDETIYYCIKNAKGIDPSNAEYWRIYDKMFVGKNPPASTQKGLIWIELVD